MPTREEFKALVKRAEAGDIEACALVLDLVDPVPPPPDMGPLLAEARRILAEAKRLCADPGR